MKPNLKPCVKAGPSKTKCALNIGLPTSHDEAQHIEAESNQKTSVQETVGSFVSNVHSNPEDTPVSEDMKDELPMPLGSPVKTDLQMDMDTAVDLSVSWRLAGHARCL